MIDEYYLKDICDREQAKKEVYKRFGGKLPLRKPKLPSGRNRQDEKKNEGFQAIYAVFMESDKYWYDRFYQEIDTYCFDPDCHKHVTGKMVNFPYSYRHYFTTDGGGDKKIYFCSYDCKHRFKSRLQGEEGEWQDREDYTINGGIFGYIYCIYNRADDTYYIGQTKYVPFFRWQEHVKSKLKGDITDLAFWVVTKVRYNSQIGISDNQELLNNVEAWWIKDYTETYGQDRVKNLRNAKFTFTHYEQLFEQMKRGQLSIL